MKFARRDSDALKIVLGSILVFSLDFFSTIFLINSLDKDVYGLLILYISGLALISNLLLGGLNKSVEIAGSMGLRKVFLDVLVCKLKYLSLPFVIYFIYSLWFNPFENSTHYGIYSVYSMPLFLLW